MSDVNCKCWRDAFGESPMTVRSFHAASMNLHRFASAFGAGSVAVTLKPRARYKAAQLAPIAPVPTIAMFRICLFFDIGMLSILVYAIAVFVEVSSAAFAGCVPW